MSKTEADKEEYEKELRARQAAHLEKVHQFAVGQKTKWRPCLHDKCTECHGTGIRIDGSQCVHAISCPCPKCQPYS